MENRILFTLDGQQYNQNEEIQPITNIHFINDKLEDIIKNDKFITNLKNIFCKNIQCFYHLNLYDCKPSLERLIFDFSDIVLVNNFDNNSISVCGKVKKYETQYSTFLDTFDDWYFGYILHTTPSTNTNTNHQIVDIIGFNVVLGVNNKHGKNTFFL